MSLDNLFGRRFTKDEFVDRSRDLLNAGYRQGAPDQRTANIDIKACAMTSCPVCGEPLASHPFTGPNGEYTNLATCSSCGYVVEF